jgi:hypothetical protein
MTETGSVAIYWDFENIHACLVDEAGGDGYRNAARYKPQEVFVDIERIVRYAASLGTVVVHRAYANWQSFWKYAPNLQAHAIDLVQLFPLSGMKNGADIRLVLDAAQDLYTLPHITHVVVVGSDSDYTALAQRCRGYGRYFVGVGAARTAAAYIAACDEFRAHHELPASPGFSQPVIAPAVSVVRAGNGLADDRAALENAATLVVAAIRRLAAENGDPWVLKAAVRPKVGQLDPAFDEKALGFATFADLVRQLSGQIAERAGRWDHELAVRDDLASQVAGLTEADGLSAASSGLDNAA